MAQKKRPWDGRAVKRLLSGLLVAVIMTVSFCTPVMAADTTARTYNYSSYIAEWAATNSDVQGWVYVGGTNINYPVVFYPEDTLYYNALGYNKQYSKNGVIWADALTRGGSRSDMTQNTVLYGHNWTNVSANPRIGNAGDVMFGQLTAYHHYDFAREHQFINYSTGEENLVFQIFAVFYTEDTFMYNRSTPTSDQFKEIVSGARARSLHNFDIEVTSTDKLITLSTCTRAFGATDRQRFVVMGKLVSSGTGMVGVTANPNYQRPKL